MLRDPYGKAAKSSYRYGRGAPAAKAGSQREEAKKYEFRDGKKIVREYGEMGLRNAFHLIIAEPEPLLVELLVDL